jgi:hypothetical protein
VAKKMQVRGDLGAIQRRERSEDEIQRRLCSMQGVEYENYRSER